MKFKMFPVGGGPEKYELSGETITVYDTNGDFESFDFSELQVGDELIEVVPVIVHYPGHEIVREARRDDSGELHLTIGQNTPIRGYWHESKEYEGSEFVQGRQYIRQLIDGVRLLDPPWEV